MLSQQGNSLVRVFNDILMAIGKQKEVILIMLDLSSAFDTIDHAMLLRRLSDCYGLNAQHA